MSSRTKETPQERIRRAKEAARARKGAPASSSRGEMDRETEAVAKRHELQLKELLFLLKHKVSSGQDFLKHKLTKSLDTQLRGLVNGRLKQDFDALHKYLHDRELAIATDIFAWRKLFFPQILASIKVIEEEQKKDLELIRKAEYALEQGPAHLLESTAVQQLASAMHAATKRDSLSRTRLLEAQVSLAEHRVFGLAGVKRATDRVFIARSPDGDAEAAKTAFQAPTTKVTAASLDVKRLHWVAVYGIMYRQLMARWSKKFGETHAVSVEVELDGMLREMVEALGTDFNLVQEIVAKVFLKYDSRVTGDAKTKLQEEVADCFGAAFHMSQAQASAFVEGLKARVDYTGEGQTSRETVAAAWAMHWEKALEGAVNVAVLERKPKVIALTAPADEEASFADGGEGGDGDAGEENGVAYPVAMN